MNIKEIKLIVQDSVQKSVSNPISTKISFVTEYYFGVFVWNSSLTVINNSVWFFIQKVIRN